MRKNQTYKFNEKYQNGTKTRDAINNKIHQQIYVLTLASLLAYFPLSE